MRTESKDRRPSGRLIRRVLAAAQLLAVVLMIGAAAKSVLHASAEWSHIRRLEGAKYGVFEPEVLASVVDGVPASAREAATMIDARLLVILGPNCGSCSEITDAWANALTNTGLRVGVTVASIGRQQPMSTSFNRLFKVAATYQLVGVANQQEFSSRTGVYDFPVAVLWRQGQAACLVMDQVRVNRLRDCVDEVKKAERRLVPIWPSSP